MPLPTSPSAMRRPWATAYPTGVRDKDGISAGLLVTEMAAVLKAEGRGVQDVLDDLATAHGVHATSQVSLRFTDLSAIRR